MPQALLRWRAVTAYKKRESEKTVYEINQIVTMKKQHPCGGKTWKIVRVGADIKLQCEVCGKYVNLTKDQLKSRIKKIEPVEVKE